MIGREEPFRLALGALRDRLRDGGFPPGERIAAIEVAQQLRLSPTPVREALSRLAGEGLLDDRRGQGYFVRSLSALDVADLYRLNLAHLGLALETQRSAPRLDDPGAAGEPAWDGDPVHAVERLFQTWIGAGGGRSLVASFQTLTIQLGPVRRKELLVFPDMAEEVADLAEARRQAVAGQLQALRRFHARRVAAADRLSSLLVDRPA